MSYDGKSEVVARESGYKILGDLWETDFWGFMCALLQMFILILGIVLLAWGVLALLKVFGVFDAFPDKLGKLESKQISGLGVIGLAGLNVTLFLFMVIFSLVNTESSFGIKAGWRPSFGAYITLLLTVGAAVALVLLAKMLPAGDSIDTVTYTYVCKNCGKKAKATDKFCSACGGEIEKKQVFKEEYICASCGKKTKATDKFCSACGGVIEKRIVVKKEYVCENCGKKAKATEKFCSECGSRIKEQEVAPPQVEEVSTQI